MSDDTPAAPPAPAKPHRARHLLSGAQTLAPYVGIAVVWLGISFVPMISPEGKAEGHALLLLFAGLIQATKKEPTP